ncbi:AAA family ATPase [Schumannella luteola]
MRIVVSGTHASGKSTLISDFATRHPEFSVLPDPFELVDESWDAPGGAAFAAQLRLSAARLETTQVSGPVIAERGPWDFLAYLLASDELQGRPSSSAVLQRSAELCRAAAGHVDLLVLLPLNPRDGIVAGDDEYPELRDAMNDQLLDLIDDIDVIANEVRVSEIHGSPEQRLAMLEQLIKRPG